MERNSVTYPAQKSLDLNMHQDVCFFYYTLSPLLGQQNKTGTPGLNEVFTCDVLYVF